MFPLIRYNLRVRAIFKYWLPVLLWMALIFLMSTDLFSSANTLSVIKPVIQFFRPGISSARLVTIHSIIRKCAHVVEYFIFGMLLFWAFCRGSKEKGSWQWAGLSLIVIIIYAAGDEFHQSFISSRTASPVDVGIDTMAGMLALILSITWHSFRTNTPSSP